jgi:hypothetical protein
LINQRASAIWRELEHRANTESSFGLDDSTPSVPGVPRAQPRPASTVASSDSLETTMIDTSMDWTSRSSDRDRRARRRVDVDTEPHLMDDISSREERYIQFLREVTRSRESPDNVTGTGVSIPRRWEGMHPQGPNRGSYLLSNIGLCNFLIDACPATIPPDANVTRGRDRMPQYAQFLSNRPESFTMDSGIS